MTHDLPAISRVTRSKAEARSSYDRMSRWYDALTGDSEKKFKQIGLDLLGVQPGERLLEIGFGTGQTLLELVRRAGPDGKVFGLDISEGMRTVALERLRKAGLAERAELRLGDAAALPHPDDSLDGVFLCFTLELFDTPEIPQVLAECRRVLRPGGRLSVVAMSKLGPPNLMTRLYDWSHDKLPSTVDCRPIYARQALEAAGFAVAEARLVKMWGLPVEIVLAVRPG